MAPERKKVNDKQESFAENLPNSKWRRLTLYSKEMIADKFTIIFLFSGQGSHYRGMGRNLFDTSPCFRESLLRSDALIRRHLSRALLEELYGNKIPHFEDLLITHPAIVAIEIAMLDLLNDRGVEPDYAVGTSLGEFAAAVAAGIWNAEAALEAAVEQAKAIVRSNIEGGMLAVIHEDRERWRPSYQKHQLYLASENFNGHFTLSGSTSSLDAFTAAWKTEQKSFLRLPVAHPFHSPLIEPAQSDFTYFMAGNTLSAGQKFISGLRCTTLQDLPRDYFWHAVSKPSDFIRLTRFLELHRPCLYVDLGPSGTSANFIKHNLSPSSPSRYFQIMTPFGRELEQLDALKRLLDN